MSVIKLTPIKVGPWGSDSSNVFDINKEGDVVLKKIIVRHGAVIDSLAFEYVQNGETKTSRRYGGVGGSVIDTLILDSTGDLLKIEGTYGQFEDVVVITSLSFVTASGTCGPYGNPSATGTRFEMPTEGGKVVGFHGKYGKVLTAIGAYMVCAHN